MTESELIRKRVEGLSLIAREKVSSFLSGNRRSLFLGHGSEFADLREYVYGDDLRHIDWRATSKRHDKLIVRDFEVERNTNVIFLLDSSASMLLGRKQPRIKQAVIAVASLANAVISNKDNFGFGAFSDSVGKYFAPKGGKSHEFHIYRTLLNLVPEGKTKLGEAITKVAMSLNRRSIIIVVSDLHDNQEEMIKGFKIAKGFHHEVQVIQMTDFREYNFPNKVGKIKFIHPESNDTVVADFTNPIVEGRYHYEMNKKIEELNKFKRKLRGLKISVIESYTEQLIEKVLLSYFKAKQRGVPG
ncbi:MAG: DUF58 domain-containing protein [Candidatus Heimdallarchaeota archaeon]|nr:DUF58 domain-containing protein [Candidatus Heimdallarchaeota archaeon]